MTALVQSVKTEAAVEAKKGEKRLKKPRAPLSQRILSQLERAVLGRKISRQELSKLSQHIAKLENFLDD